MQILFAIVYNIVEGTHSTVKRRVTMTNRHYYTLNQYRTSKQNQRKEFTLFKSRQEVEVNGNGTQGYTVKSGDNEGRVLAHRSQKHNNNW